MGICLLGIATISTLRACNTANANEKAQATTKIVLGQPFELGLRKSATVPAQHLKVTFERVVEDSRCPSDVDCFWAGQATVAVRLESSGRRVKTLGTANLTVQGSGSVMPKSVRKIGPYWVKLVEVAPEKGPQNAPGTVERITLLVQDKPIAAPKSES